MSFELTDETIDVRDIIERFEELETEIENAEEEKDDSSVEELKVLTEILEELKGNGGDEKWRGDWYPITLIADRFFTEYCQELLEDCGTIPRDLPSFIKIDWKGTASNMQDDYSSIEINDEDFWYR